jgi:hypothetical protein
MSGKLEGGPIAAVDGLSQAGMLSDLDIVKRPVGKPGI